MLKRRSRPRVTLPPQVCSLAFKIGGVLAIIVGISFALHLLIDDNRSRLMAQKKIEAEKLGDLVIAIVRKEMTSNQPERVQEHLDVMLEHRDIEDIRIFAVDGQLRFALDSTQVGRYFDRNSHPDCRKCHGSSSPPQSIVRKVAGQRVFSLDYPLRNEDACLECHPSNDPVLGNLLLDVRFSEPDLAVLAGDRRLALLGILLAGLTAFGAWLLLKSIVVQPLQSLVSAAREVEAGNFEPDFPPTRADEIGELVAAFRRMTDRLGHLVGHQKEEIAAQTEELRRSQQRAVHHEKMAALGRLTGGLAHEVGNPLASISAMGQVLLRKDRDAATQETAKEILEHVDRINRIVRELLDHFHTGRRRPEIVSVSQPISTALRIARYDRGLKRLAVHTNIDPSCPRIHIVEDELVQVLVNVFLNAADAMPEGGDLQITAHSNGSQDVTIKIADTGCGIAQEDLKHVFDPFFTTKPPGKGTGLGLWVCYSIVGRWGGSMELESEPGRGTTVCITIPNGKEVELRDGEDSDHRRRSSAREESAIGA